MKVLGLGVHVLKYFCTRTHGYDSVLRRTYIVDRGTYTTNGIQCIQNSYCNCTKADTITNIFALQSMISIYKMFENVIKQHLFEICCLWAPE